MNSLSLSFFPQRNALLERRNVQFLLNGWLSFFAHKIACFANKKIKPVESIVGIVGTPILRERRKKVPTIPTMKKGENFL